MMTRLLCLSVALALCRCDVPPVVRECIPFMTQCPSGMSCDRATKVCVDSPDDDAKHPACATTKDCTDGTVCAAALNSPEAPTRCGNSCVDDTGTAHADRCQPGYSCDMN